MQCEALFVDPDARKKIDELFEKEYQDFTKKVIVLDDDPTGIQTVHDVDVYTDWTKESLVPGFPPESFVLTNSSSFRHKRPHRFNRDCRNANRGRQRDDAKFFDDLRGFHFQTLLSA